MNKTIKKTIFIIFAVCWSLGIINDILNFSRIEAGELTYDITKIVVRDAVAIVGAMILPQAKQKSLELRLDGCAPDVVANGDRAKVEQILLNLLSNGVKFTAPGGTIEVTCVAEKNVVRTCVRDTGLGISKEHHETIFAPFAQLGRSLASPKEGAGLGLSISRDLARGMGGDLRVKSELDKGSSFTLELPRAV